VLLDEGVGQLAQSGPVGDVAGVAAGRYTGAAQTSRRVLGCSGVEVDDQDRIRSPGAGLLRQCLADAAPAARHHDRAAGDAAGGFLTISGRGRLRVTARSVLRPTAH
jgi:hypothetical protein